MLEGNIDARRRHKARGDLGGVLDHGAFEEDDPGTWDTHTLGWAPKAEEQERSKLWAACVVGVGEPYRSGDVGERVTPDPAERRGLASC